MTTDLDKSGPFTKRAGTTYLGPSIGAVNSQTNVLTITTTGITNVDLNVTQIQVNAAGLVSIQLPSSLDRTTAPGTFVDAPITITDISGAAGTNIITIFPFAGELIAGAASALVSSNYGAVVLAPITTGGWTVLSYSTPADTGGGYVAKAGDTMTGTLLIEPAFGTLTKGLTTNQVGPFTGPDLSDWSYNQITIVDETSMIPASAYSTGFRVYDLIGGANAKGAKAAGHFHTIFSIPGAFTDADAIGLIGSIQASVENGGTNTGAGAKGTLFASSFSAQMAAGATNYFVVSGGEVDVAIETGASCQLRLGWSIVALGALQADQEDIAVEIGCVGSAPWKMGIAFTSLHGSPPISATGTLIGTDGVNITVANGIDLSAFTMTNFLKGPAGFLVDGAANITANSLTLPAWTDTGALAINSSGGAFTTASATGRYIKLGKTCSFSIQGTVTVVGGGAGTINIALPFVSGVGPGGGQGYVFSGMRANDAITLSCHVDANVDTLIIVMRDGTSAIMAGGVYIITGTYETA